MAEKLNDSILESTWIHNNHFNHKEEYPNICLGNYEIDPGAFVMYDFENTPEEVHGHLNCENNRLTSLKHMPKYVNSLYVTDNNITNLDYCNEELFTLKISKNYLTTLEGSLKRCYKIILSSNLSLTSLDYDLESVQSIFMFNCSVRNFRNKYCFNIDFSLITPLKLDYSHMQTRMMKDLRLTKNDIYENYFLYLLQTCIENNFDPNEIDFWPDNFLESNYGKSITGIAKFDL